MGFWMFIKKGVRVKKPIDSYNASNANSTGCNFCEKQHVLRSKLVHEEHCLVRLALEGKSDVTKMATFCLRAQDIKDELLEEGLLLFPEVMEITMAKSIPLDIMVKAFDRSIWDDYVNGRKEFMWPDGVWRKEEYVRSKKHR
jgi:hypothetical protein